MIDERWVSAELDLVAYHRAEDPTIGTIEHRLTTVDRSEPRADLFHVTDEYVAAELPYPLLWQNPYRLVNPRYR